MALARAYGAIVSGVAGHLVTVEVDHSQGLPGVGIVGLPDATVSEARHRVRTAFRNQKLTWPSGKVTVSLSPAELRKQGAGLDLAIAIGIIGATGQVSQSVLESTVFIGELGLDGGIRSVAGAVPAAIAAAQAGFTTVVLSLTNARQCQMVSGINVVSYSDLQHLLRGLAHKAEPLNIAELEPMDTPVQPDLVDVLGQHHARWALEVAAAGGHHLFMLGAPGVGKTMLAERLPGILPALTSEHALEVASIHSIAGTLDQGIDINRPPFEAPHHSSSMSAIIGSVHGHSVRPGAVTKAHRGVLFLDEAPEFSRNALEVLRQPLESGRIVLNRSHWSGIVPAQFQLIMAANPCPCGNALPDTPAKCVCRSIVKQHYFHKLSGPLMDRIDINMLIPSVNAVKPGERSAIVAQRVGEARERANRRFRHQAWSMNADIPPDFLRGEYSVNSNALSLLEELHQREGGLRGAHRILRVSWTIADLNGRDRPSREDLAMAIHLRERPLGQAA